MSHPLLSVFQMTPQHVVSNLCGGGCHSPSHSCVATSHRLREVPVLLSSCMVGSSLCSKTCALLQVREDTGCKCDCLEEQRECHSDKHSFSTHSCQCECRDMEEYRLCRDQDKLWNSTQCSCSCPVDLVKPCSTGG